MKVHVLTEDTYGREFIRKLTNRLKYESFIERDINIEVTRYNIYKIKSIIKTSLIAYDKIIVFIDCDGECLEGSAELISREIDKQKSNNVTQIKFRWEIEDWLCVSYGFPIEREKSSIVMKKKKDYKKFQLPKYVDKLDIKKLKSLSDTFSAFLKALK